MPAHPTALSIAVVYYDSPLRELEALLASLITSVACLRRDFALDRVALFLVDNSEDAALILDNFTGFQTQLDSQGIDLEIISGQGNVGYGRAHNLVLERVHSDVHLMLNPDVILDEDSLREGMSFLRDNPEVALVSPRAVDSRGRHQALCKRYPAVFTFLVRGFFPASLKKLFARRLARFEMQDLDPDSPGRQIPICSGCCMLCRTEKLKQVSGFDPRYFLYFEDFDLSLRLAKTGELVYLPGMKIVHDGGHAAGKGWKHIRLFLQSARRFFSAHGWQWLRQ